MIRAAHAAWSGLTDGAAFGFINALQLLGRGGRHDAAAFEAYVERWEGRTMEEYFAIPEGTKALPGFPNEAGAVEFSSAVETGVEENDRVHLDVWPGPQGWDSPAMILLHGLMSVSDVGYRLWARHLNRLGWTALFFHLPYHYNRRMHGTLSGEVCLSSNLIRSGEACRQGVVDLRRVCQELRRRGAPEVGCWATSYGGWLASLLCVVEEGLSTAWLIEPLVDIEHSIWNSPATRTLRWQLGRRGIQPELLARHMPLVCPTHHVPKTPAERILLVAGAFDSITPVASMKKLCARWPGSHYAELLQGHVGYQLMPASWRLAMEHMPGLFAKATSDDLPG